MPTYQYECDSCGHSMEVLQSMMDKKIKKCPECGQLKLVRLIGAGSGVIFKGTGFYETDFKTKDKPSGEDGKSDSKPDGKSDSKSDGKLDSKSDSKSDNQK